MVTIIKREKLILPYNSKYDDNIYMTVKTPDNRIIDYDYETYFDICDMIITELQDYLYKNPNITLNTYMTLSKLHKDYKIVTIIEECYKTLIKTIIPKLQMIMKLIYTQHSETIVNEYAFKNTDYNSYKKYYKPYINNLYQLSTLEFNLAHIQVNLKLITLYCEENTSTVDSTVERNNTKTKIKLKVKI